jgi:hypothetical protein
MKRDGTRVERRQPEILLGLTVDDIAPVRLPKAHRKQSNKPMLYWSARTQQLVWCESRLEGAALRAVEWKQRSTAFLQQPFVLHFRVDGRWHEHTPDFLEWREKGGRSILNAKPMAYVDIPRNRLAFAACDELAAQLGWEHEVLTEGNPVTRDNQRFLSGYRRVPMDAGRFAAPLLERIGEHATIASALAGLDPEALARPVLFHLMWTRVVLFDDTRILGDSTPVWLAGSTV